MGFRSSDANRLYQIGAPVGKRAAPAPYAAAKAGVIMLTRQVANEVGKGYRSGAEGIRTPDLRRAKAARYFAGVFSSLQNRCKRAYFLHDAFPELSGH